MDKVDLSEFASSMNFCPPAWDLDGRIHRFDRQGNNNAWYIGFQLFMSKTGDPMRVAVFGDWKTGDKYEWKSVNGGASKEDRDVIKMRLAEAAKKSEEERRSIQKEAASRAASLIKEGRPGPSPYIDNKKLSSLHGALTILGDDGRILLVPMRDIDGVLHGVQRIAPDGRKKFVFGQRVSGTFHVIGDLNDSFIYVAEGFATAATIREATGRTVVAAFNAGNLEEVSREIKRRHPNKAVMIAGDDDRWTEGNPGRTKAEAAARSALGATVFPVFRSPVEGQTDWNDLLVSEGMDSVRRQLSGACEPEPTGYIPLGFDEGTHFFFDLGTRNILKVITFSETELLRLMKLEYWETAYPSVKGGVRWTQAKSDLIESSKSTGPFDVFRIRGTGVWRDRNRTILNMGESMVADGEHASMASLRTQNVYVETKNRLPPVHQKPLTAAETGALRSACEGLNWKDPRSGWFLAGWIAISRIAGALPVRPHVWLTGGSGTGKSTVMDRLISPALGSQSGRLYLQGGTTEAGVRQSIKADSLPIIFDEFETTNEATKERTLALIELLRQSWSATQGHVVKGSAGGQAAHYAMSFAGLVSSIRIVLDNDADRSRFTVLELAPHGSDQEQWSRVKSQLVTITEEYGERLFARMIQMTPVVIQNFEVLSKAIAGIVSQRYGQQLGMIMAGWYALMSDDPVTDQIAKGMADDLGLGEEKAEADESDEWECLNQIMTTKIGIMTVTGDRREETIGEILVSQNWMMIDTLKSFGILLEADFIIIAQNHATLRKSVFERTRWTNWARSLLRIPGAKKAPAAKRFASQVSKAVMIPRSVLSK